MRMALPEKIEVCFPLGLKGGQRLQFGCNARPVRIVRRLGKPVQGEKDAALNACR
jgi:hypothetical protein